MKRKLLGTFLLVLLVGCSQSTYGGDIDLSDNAEISDIQAEINELNDQLDGFDIQDYLDMKIELEHANSKISNLETEIQGLKEVNEELDYSLSEIYEYLGW